MSEHPFIALDIGGVCLEIRPERCFGLLGYRSIGEVPPALLAGVERYERGRIGEAEFLALFRDATGSDLPDDFIRSAWNAILAAEMPGMAELVRELQAAGTDIVLFSDTSPLHMTEFRRSFEIARLLPDGVYSFVVGARKPDPAMFAALEADYGKPSLYVDDRELCLSGAKAFGWPVCRFESVKQLRRVLQERDLL